MNIDATILETLNSLVANRGFWFHVLAALGNNPLLRGGVVFASLTMVATAAPSEHAKGQILLGLIATTLALAVSLWCQSHVHLHLRPVFDGNIEINDVDGFGINKYSWGARLYSLPSDTATAFFASATIIFIQRKLLGLFCFLWIFLTVGICRVALGIHYPSDILAGLFLGFGLVYLFTNLTIAEYILIRLMQRYDVGGCIYVTAICLFSAEAYSLFPGLQEIYVSLKQLFNNYVT